MIVFNIVSQAILNLICDKTTHQQQQWAEQEAIQAAEEASHEVHGDQWLELQITMRRHETIEHGRLRKSDQSHWMWTRTRTRRKKIESSLRVEKSRRREDFNASKWA